MFDDSQCLVVALWSNIHLNIIELVAHLLYEYVVTMISIVII